MCVKEFFGYVCGHCSIPYIRPCPVSQSCEQFPICKYPAERPTQIDTYCHPCMRVAWNAQVLSEEHQHRQRHIDGECECPIVFQGVEEERMRLEKDKGKGKAVAPDDVGQNAPQTAEKLKFVAGSRSDSVTSPREGWEDHTKHIAYRYTGYHHGVAGAAASGFMDLGIRKAKAPMESQASNDCQAQSGNPAAFGQTQVFGYYDDNGIHNMVNLGELLNGVPLSDSGEDGAAALIEQPWQPVKGYSNQGMDSTADSARPTLEARIDVNEQSIQSGMKWYPTPSEHPLYEPYLSYTTHKPHVSQSSNPSSSRYNHQSRHKRPRKAKSEGHSDYQQINMHHDSRQAHGDSADIAVDDEAPDQAASSAGPAIVSSSLETEAASDKVGSN